MIKTINDFYYFFHLDIGHRLVTGYAQFLSVYPFCNWKAKIVPFFIASLLMGWNRVMNDCLNAIVCQKVFKQVTFLTEDGEDMEDALN